MSLNQEHIVNGWFACVFVGTGLPAFLIYIVIKKKRPDTPKFKVFVVYALALFNFAMLLPQWPKILRRTVAEYQYRYQNGPDPETLFHDIQAEANYVPSHSKFDSFARALGGDSKKRRRPRGAPSTTPTPSGAASTTVNAVNPTE